MYSGGGLIEGLAFDDPEVPAIAGGIGPEEAVEDFIQALRINRHAIVMMDRDCGEDGELKDRVTRIVGELDCMGGLSWVTAGRTVENYIPLAALSTFVGKSGYRMPEVPGQYDKFFDKIFGPRGGRLGDYKTAFAKRVSELLTRELLKETLDLARMLDQVCNRIREWNGLECPPRPGGTGGSSTSAYDRLT
jgi:hypothetical protein